MRSRGLFLLVVLGFAYFHGGGMANQASRFDAIAAFVEPDTPDTGTFRIDRFLFDKRASEAGLPEPTVPAEHIGNTIDWSFYPPPAKGGRARPDSARGEVQGHYYSNKAPGSILLGAAAYLALYHGERLAGLDPRGAAFEVNLYLINLLVSVLPAALGILAFGRILIRLGLPIGQAQGLSLCLAFSTMLFPYSTAFFGHATAAAFCLFGLQALLQDSSRGYFLAGFWAASAAVTDYSAALNLALFVLFAWRARSGRAALVLLAGTALPLAVCGAYQYACFGSPFALATDYTAGVFREEGKLLGLLGAIGIARVRDLLFSGYRGLLAQMPVLVFSLIGLWRWFKRKPSDPLAWLCLAGMALFLAANASFNGWHGGAVVCARYQIPALGFWALAWKELPWTGLWKKLFLAAAAFSAFNMLSVAAVSPMMPDGREQGGLYGWTTPRFLSGKLAGEGSRDFFVLRINGRRLWEPTNGGLLLGLGGLWSLLPLAGVLGAGLYFRRRGRMGAPLKVGLLALFLAGTAAAGDSVGDLVRPLEARHPGKSGLFVLERGEDSLLARYWMIEHASKTIDAQYFIWTADNVGILAAEALLRAADRGVKVRVIVDDLLVDAPAGQMLALAKHPNADIRIYNPNLNLGTRPLRRLWNALSDLRAVNQRMHDKTFVVDGAAAITGGRNVADEYFDFDQEYNFRDRDILVVGPGARAMQASFQRFWDDARSVPVEKLLAPAPGERPAEAVFADLRAYARDPANFAPEVRRALLELPRRVPELVKELVWADARFLCDIPGKNPGQEGLKGSGVTTRSIAAAVSGAKKSVTIQSPYCVLTPEALELLGGLARRGVSVRILTNSLAASDNLQATSGYLKQRGRILDAGIGLFEFRPDPEIRRRLMAATRAPAARPPIFAVHAKTLVVDSRTLFIGTFNLDPRSAHLNTEVGILVDEPRLALEVERAIEGEMAPGNAWPAGTADGKAPWGHRIKAFLYRLLPLTPLL